MKDDAKDDAEPKGERMKLLKTVQTNEVETPLHYNKDLSNVTKNIMTLDAPIKNNLTNFGDKIPKSKAQKKAQAK